MRRTPHLPSLAETVGHRGEVACAEFTTLPAPACWASNSDLHRCTQWGESRVDDGQDIYHDPGDMLSDGLFQGRYCHHRGLSAPVLRSSFDVRVKCCAGRYIGECGLIRRYSVQAAACTSILASCPRVILSGRVPSAWPQCHDVPVESCFDMAVNEPSGTSLKCGPPVSSCEIDAPLMILQQKLTACDNIQRAERAIQ